MNIIPWLQISYGSSDNEKTVVWATELGILATPTLATPTLTLRDQVTLLLVKAKKYSCGITGTVPGCSEATGEECHDD